MTGWAADPRAYEVAVSLALLAASYLGARLLSYALGVLAARSSRAEVDDRLLSALKHPVTYALFLVGAWVALHRLPLGPGWMARLDAMLFVFAVLLLTLALERSYAILLDWYATSGRMGSGGHLATEFRPLFSKVGRIFIALVAAITLLQHFGVNVASLVVSLGVGSLAVGLAAQDTLSNMFAGFTLMLDRPFRVGDRIQLASGEVGDVQAIGMRATLIKTVDETLLVVPNSVLVKERLVNQTLPTRHITTRVPVAVAYGSDLAQVKAILAGAAFASPAVDREREPLVLVNKIAEFSVGFLLVFWVRDYTEQAHAVTAVHEEIYRRLQEAGIEIPVPTSRVIHEGARAPQAEGEA